MDFRIFSLDITDSTHLYARRALSEGLVSGKAAIRAKVQKRGMGTKGRTWHSDNNLGLWVTLVLPPSPAPLFPRVMTLSVSIVNLFIRRGVRAGIQWPNDIMIIRKKICGLLAEKLEKGLLLSAGVNLNQQTVDFPVDIRDRATSFFLEKREPWPVEDFFSDLLREFDTVSCLPDLPSAYRTRLCILGKEMEFNGQAVTVENVEEDGAIALKHHDGSIRNHYSGTLVWKP